MSRLVCLIRDGCREESEAAANLIRLDTRTDTLEGEGHDNCIVAWKMVRYGTMSRNYARCSGTIPRSYKDAQERSDESKLVSHQESNKVDAWFKIRQQPSRSRSSVHVPPIPPVHAHPGSSLSNLQRDADSHATSTSSAILSFPFPLFLSPANFPGVKSSPPGPSCCSETSGTSPAITCASLLRP